MTIAREKALVDRIVEVFTGHAVLAKFDDNKHRAIANAAELLAVIGAASEKLPRAVRQQRLRSYSTNVGQAATVRNLRRTGNGLAAAYAGLTSLQKPEILAIARMGNQRSIC